MVILLWFASRAVSGEIRFFRFFVLKSCSETDYYKYSYDIGNGGGTEGTDEEPVVEIYIDE